MGAEKAKKSVGVRFGFLAAAYWSIMATYAGFMIPYGLDRGYKQSIVSVMCAGYMICTFAGQFYWGSVCDRKRTNKKVFILGIVLAEAAQLGMFFFNNIVCFGILYALFGFLMGPMGSILDTWMLRSIRYDMKVYGVARGSGSGLYAIMTLITGFLIEHVGYITMPILSSLFVVFTIVIAFTSEDAAIAGEEGGKSGSISIKDILSIMKIPAYVVLLVVVFLIGVANSPINSLKIVVLESVGGNVSTLGLDTFWGCTLQFILFLMAGYLARIPAKYRLMISASAMFVAMGIDFKATAPWMIIVGTLFMNVQYGFLMPALRETILHMVDAKYQTTANGLADAFYGSMSGAISLMYAGALAQSYGVKTMVGLSVVISAFPVIILLVQEHVLRQKGRK